MSMDYWNLKSHCATSSDMLVLFSDIEQIGRNLLNYKVNQKAFEMN
eukprot:CAMPEP_0116897518 /NCGR_PEP_ID=MMETSP0467-20121206/6470_1 /TAXON_ID=283647 /ORGANISM="Mesodinium pulex, Strain SPMC105" /LENGTH=45 /DNA_ID= /DNA_START= /DNA_END= /DNA_ORIENTATION=